MNKLIKEKWIKALRSGEFKQGQGNLKTGIDSDSCYCCLGVLCELAKNEGITKEDFNLNLNIFNYDGSDEFLPKSVSEWAELDDADPEVSVEVKREYHHIKNLLTISDCNDNGCSFDEISKIIEKNY